MPPINQDEEHLKLLAIFHYVVAGLAGFMSLFPCIYLAMGLFLVFGAPKLTGPGQNPPPALLGWLFVVIAAVFITIGLTIAALILVAGRRLARHKNHTFCLVVAAIECLFMPFGTVLGIFTIIVLNRETVKPLFTAPSLPPAP